MNTICRFICIVVCTINANSMQTQHVSIQNLWYDVKCLKIQFVWVDCGLYNVNMRYIAAAVLYNHLHYSVLSPTYRFGTIGFEYFEIKYAITFHEYGTVYIPSKKDMLYKYCLIKKVHLSYCSPTNIAYTQHNVIRNK